MYNNTLYINPETLRGLGFVNEATQDSVLNINIKNIQDTVIEPLLGKELHNEILKDVYEKSNTPKYRLLIEQYLTFIVGYRIQGVIALTGYDFGNSGISKNADANIYQVNYQDARRVSNNCINRASKYERELLLFLSKTNDYGVTNGIKSYNIGLVL